MQNLSEQNIAYNVVFSNKLCDAGVLTQIAINV
jgi:hypothetical protein